MMADCGPVLYRIPRVIRRAIKAPADYFIEYVSPDSVRVYDNERQYAGFAIRVDGKWYCEDLLC